MSVPMSYNAYLRDKQIDTVYLMEFGYAKPHFRDGLLWSMSDYPLDTLNDYSNNTQRFNYQFKEVKTNDRV